MAACGDEDIRRLDVAVNYGVLPVSLRKFVRQTTVFGSRGYDANTR